MIIDIDRVLKRAAHCAMLTGYERNQAGMPLGRPSSASAARTLVDGQNNHSRPSVTAMIAVTVMKPGN
jgi:hypothetical protein